MNFRRYLVLMALSWVVAAAAMGGFTLLVDAIGISPVRIPIAGFNALKPLREDYDWMAKRYDVWRKQPTTILIGSSRVKQSIDPGLLANTEFGVAYNAGMNGSANFLETKAYVQDYLRADKNLQHLFIEAFTTALVVHPETARPFITPTEGTTRPIVVGFGFASDLAELMSVFFSFGGLTSAIRTISANWNPQGSSPGSSHDGFAPIALAPHHFSVRNALNFVLHSGLIQRGTELSPLMMTAAKQMIADCERHLVECRFFVSPLHADVLYAMYYLGLWPELEKLKRGLAQLAPTYDFTRYSPVIDERIGPVLYWPEAFHFSPALGELMTRAMTGLRTSDMPENFGALLEPGNLDASLAAWRKERDSWIAQHPEVVERMRKAEENFRAGVSFKTVTDAEIAAGGW